MYSKWQFQEYVGKVFESKNITPPTPEETLQYFRDAGFVDIQIHTRLMDIGDWRGGIS